MIFCLHIAYISFKSKKCTVVFSTLLVQYHSSVVEVTYGSFEMIELRDLWCTLTVSEYGNVPAKKSDNH
jgi:hypothetical protein